MNGQPYPSYKPSGVQWLGDIPEGWNCLDLKYVATANDADWPESTIPETEILYVDIGSVDGTSGIRSKEAMLFDVAPSRARRRVTDGDVIVSTVRTYLRAIAPIRDPEPNLTVSTGFAVIRPRKVNPDFLAHSLASSYFVESVVSISTGVSYPATNPGDILNLPLPFPPEREQTRISAFLDRETAKIDELIAKKRELIERLKEKRTALISHIVTKGLPPEEAAKHGLLVNPPLKPSGVPWLGDIPEHWKMKPFKSLFRFVSGGTPSTATSEYWDGGIPWVSSKDVKQFELEDTEDHISELAVRESATTILKRESMILVARSGILRHTLPVAVILRDMAINQDIKGCIPSNEAISQYFVYLVQGNNSQLLTLWRQQGATVESLAVETMRSALLPVPPVEEQRAIASFLSGQRVLYDATLLHLAEAIEKLKEYRSALITAAVTGKIDVREEVIA
jgi:type I restriction enzyme S subunit